MKNQTRHLASLAGQKISVIGLGRFGGGVGVSRWLCAQGAHVTVSDQAPADQLGDSIAALKDLPVTFHLGGHTEADFLEADLLVINPAVPKELPLLVRALQIGRPWTTEMNLFLERCPAPIVGITGSVGKSTTTAMIGEILRGRFNTHVGGNIGRSLLDELPTIAADHVVVLELSSFQLDDTPGVGISPHVAVVTNLAANHLDRHGTMEAYASAKKNIYRFQGPDDVLVLNSACPITSAWAGEAHGRVAFFDGSMDREVAEPFELAVPGRHNQADAQAAFAAVRQLGVSRQEAANVLRQFRGLAHRLELVAERRGVRYFNDSKCTTPQGAIVALEAFDRRRAIILVGGYDKHVSFDAMAAVLADRAKAVVALGATREAILSAVEAHRGGDAPVAVRADSFEQAVTSAAAMAAPGDVVLLSPACASYDMFVNYEQRGRRFVELVTAMK